MSKRAKVLVVDDEKGVLQAATEVLQREGIAVVAVEDADETGEEGESLSHLPYAEAKKRAMRAFERRYLSALLEKSNHNISSAARAAGVDRSNFRRLLKQYEVGGRSAHADEGAEDAPPRVRAG